MSATLLVLAAGMGSRYGTLKQLDAVGSSGETIIDYSVYDAKRAGFDKVVFVIRKDFEEEFKEKVTSKFNTIEVDFVYQDLKDIPEGFKISEKREKPLGTAHALWVARKKITNVFSVINADDFYGRHSFKVLYDYLLSMKKSEVSRQCMVGFKLYKTLSENGSVSRGICQISEEDFLIAITERTQIFKKYNKIVYEDEGRQGVLNNNAIVSMNMFGFSSAIFNHLEEDLISFLKTNKDALKAEFYIPTVVNNLIKNKIANVAVLPTNSNWFGVTYKEDKNIVKKKIEELISEGEYPKKLWK